MRDAGVALAVVSNFDTRLRPILEGMHIDRLFDAVIVSAGEAEHTHTHTHDTHML